MGLFTKLHMSLLNHLAVPKLRAGLGDIASIDVFRGTPADTAPYLASHYVIIPYHSVILECLSQELKGTSLYRCCVKLGSKVQVCLMLSFQANHGTCFYPMLHAPLFGTLTCADA